MNAVSMTTVPKESVLYSWLADADFHDAWVSPMQSGELTPTEIFLRAARSTPRWVALLMSIRKGIVRKFGLKDVGSMGGMTDKAADAYRAGDRLGIFGIMEKTENELLLGIDDRHLDVRVSVLKTQQAGYQTYVISTVVRCTIVLAGPIWCQSVEFIPLSLER